MQTVRRLGTITRVLARRQVVTSFSRLNFARLEVKGLCSMPRYEFSEAKDNKPYEDDKNKIRDTQTGPGFQSVQFKTACLSLYSYVISSNGEAVIIDPMNEIEQYKKILKEKNLTLKYIVLTHFHADYVSGQTDLTRTYSGVKIVMGPGAKSSAYEVQVLNQHEQIKIGSVTLEAIHTPGHTLESTCFLLKDENGKPQALYSGDTVFNGEVGRPDLASNSNITSQDLAKLLFASIQKIKKLPDDLTIFPGHGSGSACGKNIGKGDKTTIGAQKEKNYAFRVPLQSSFVAEVLKGLKKPPNYFFNSVETNKENPFDFEKTLHEVFKPLTPDEFQQEMKKPNTIVLDVRSKSYDFHQKMIKGAYFVGYEGPMATFVGTLFKPTDNFLIYGHSKGQSELAVKRLLRIGYQNVKGYNDFDLDEWQGQTVKYPEATTQDLKAAQQGKSRYSILDIRNAQELQSEGKFTESVTNVPLVNIFQSIQKGSLDKSKKYLVHCASGYRSKICATYLGEHGYDFKILSDKFRTYRDKGVKVVL